MRKLILQMQTSVDGFVARADGRLDWTVWNFSDDWTWDAELKQEFNDILAGIDGIVLSGNMGGEGFIDHWTNMAAKHRGEAAFAFAQRIADVPKFIFSNSIPRSTWETASILKGDLREGIQALKKEAGKALITFGGAAFAASLLRAGLVDELQLFVNPRILGEGISIFAGIPNLNPTLISSRPYTCGITVLKYRL